MAGGGLHTALGRQGSVGLLGDRPAAYIESNLLNSPFFHATFSPYFSRLPLLLAQCAKVEKRVEIRETYSYKKCS